MFEVFVGTIKLLLSKDFKNTFREILAWSKNAPEWGRDIVKIDAKISKHEKEQAKAFVQVIQVKLTEAHFYRDAISDFLSAFQELIDNGFNHGCERDSDSVTLRVVVFGAGASAESINNNKKRKIPKLDSLPESEGPRGNGLRFAMSVVDQISLTHEDRGVKIVMYQRDDDTYLKEEGITFVPIGGFVSDVESRIKNALRYNKGKVILVFGKHEPIARSMLIASFDTLANRDLVTQFAIISSAHTLARLNELKKDFPKLVGCYESAEEAIAALKPEQAEPPTTPTKPSTTSKPPAASKKSPAKTKKRGTP